MGRNRFAAATGPMANEIAKSSSEMTDTDLHAVATYLRDQPVPKEATAKPLISSDPTMKLGAAIYDDECSACHTLRGTGVSGLFPAMAGAPAVQSTDPTSAIRVVLRGTQSVATDCAPTGPAMPGFAWLLDDRQTAALLIYIRNAWRNAVPGVTAGDVSKGRETLAKGDE